MRNRCRVTCGGRGSRGDRHRPRAGNLALVLLLVIVLLLIGLTFLSRASGERRLTEQLLAHERSQALGEAAVAEAFLSVQKTMNVSGNVWFSEMRRPVAQTGGQQEFTPARTIRLMGELLGPAAASSKLACRLKLLAPVAIQAAAPQLAEKTVFLECEARVAIGGVERKLRRVREVRVSLASLPPPLDAFGVWIFGGPGAGCLRTPASYPVSPIAPLDAAARRAVEQDWKYRWGSDRSRFPFARGRVSEYHPDWKTFLARRRTPSGDLRLSGVAVIGDPADFTLAGGRILGDGALWIPDGSLKLSAVGLDSPGLPQIAVLGAGKRLELDGYPRGARIRAALAAPDGTLVTEPDMRLEGSLYAGQWLRPQGTSFTPASRSDACLATLSEVQFAP